MRRYPLNRRPYIEYTQDERKVHARILGWQENMILVEYPPLIIDKFTHGQRTTSWINKAIAKRIRRTDSVWATMDDDMPWHDVQDMPWHDVQDQKINRRTDPWTIYEQEFPDRD